MKNINLRVLTLVLIFGAQAFAQRFISSEPDGFSTGLYRNGYNPNLHQIAVLGEKNSKYANLMLAGVGIIPDNEVVQAERLFYVIADSYGYEFGNIWPIPQNSELYQFTNAIGESIYDNTVGAVAVLDSFSDNKNTAIVLFATFKRLIIVELKINNSNFIEHSVLKNLEMPESVASQATGKYGKHGQYRRLALLGTSGEGSSKAYHIAISDPNYQNAAYSGNGRIDFFSIKKNPWELTQPNTKGIISGDNIFNQSTTLGIDLVSVGDLDGNGYSELAVLLSPSGYFPNGGIYIFFMENEYTPNLMKTVTISGESMPWKEDVHKNHVQNCKGMSFTTWKNEPHLLLSCNATYSGSYIVFIKDIILNSSGHIKSTNIFAAQERNSDRASYVFSTNSNPVPIKNHKNNGYAVALPIYGSCFNCGLGFLNVYRVADADASKNFSIEAGKEETIANIDSLFYNSGAKGYTVKTLSGLAKCRVQTINELICAADERAHGSWSMVELGSNGACDPYRACKAKDTIYVYARTNLEPANTALRIPKDIVTEMQNRSFTIDNISSLAYFKNPGNLNTDIEWNKTSLNFISITNEIGDNLSIAPLPHKGIDTIVFSLTVHNSTNRHPIRVHVADSSEILKGEVPATPGNDTICNIAQKRYIALPPSGSNGNIYTYDIAQDSLGKYAEILGDYLHILNIDIAEISIAYTENSEIKYRKIILMPEPKPSPPSSLDYEYDEDNKGQSPILGNVISSDNLKAFYSGGSLHINGATGELNVKAYNFKGVEIQREKITANGSASLKLKQNSPQIVQISTPSKRIYITIFP